MAKLWQVQAVKVAIGLTGPADWNIIPPIKQYEYYSETDQDVIDGKAKVGWLKKDIVPDIDVAEDQVTEYKPRLFMNLFSISRSRPFGASGTDNPTCPYLGMTLEGETTPSGTSHPPDHRPFSAHAAVCSRSRNWLARNLWQLVRPR